MRDNLNIGTSDGPHTAVRGPHHIDPTGWKPVTQGEFELRARLLVRPAGEAIIVKCFSSHGQFDDSETGELGASLMGLAKLGYVQILLNLQGVQFASGSLLGSLASLHREVVRSRGFLRLFGLEPIVPSAADLSPGYNPRNLRNRGGSPCRQSLRVHGRAAGNARPASRSVN